MFKLLIKDANFKWVESLQHDFETLKAKLSVEPILMGPNWALTFHISTDSSDMAIGGVLGQKEYQVSYVIYITSKNLTPSELH